MIEMDSALKNNTYTQLIEFKDIVSDGVLDSYRCGQRTFALLARPNQVNFEMANKLLLDTGKSHFVGSSDDGFNITLDLLVAEQEFAGLSLEYQLDVELKFYDVIPISYSI
jgi:hypothetical protein